MKIPLFLFLVFNCIQTFSQCPQPGLQIQSASCDSASNLLVTAISCSEIKVKWQGNQGQSYTVKATGIDAVTNTNYEANVSNHSCGSDGNCQATIAVKENSVVNWSVQSTCTQGGGTISGFVANGMQVTIPACPKPGEIVDSKKLHAYPNPTIGDLTVDYSGMLSAYTKISVFDMTGKKVYSVSANTITRTNTGFKLDLHQLISGNYLLQIVNGKEQSQVKFVLIRD